MYLGKVVEVGPAEALCAAPAAPVHRGAALRGPDPRPRRRAARAHRAAGRRAEPGLPPSGCRFHTRCRYATEVCARRPSRRSCRTATATSRPATTRGTAAGVKAIVVGAGVFGAATADALAARGWDVTVVEQYAPGNARGSSGDRTRLLRLGHGEFGEAQDLHYIRSAARGIELWRALGRGVGRRADRADRPGVAGAGDGGLEDAASRARMDAAGAPYERITPAETAALFPGMTVDDLAFALYEPGACVIRASAAVDALLRRAGARRAVLDRAEPAGPRAVRAGRRRAPGRLRRLGCGAWLGALFRARRRCGRRGRTSCTGARRRRGATGPAWVDEQRRPATGSPTSTGSGSRRSATGPGRRSTSTATRACRTRPWSPRSPAYLARRFPPLAGTGLLWGRVMAYEMTPDGHFVAGPAGVDGHWLLGGGSGHGFKHAPGARRARRRPGRGRAPRSCRCGAPARADAPRAGRCGR